VLARCRNYPDAEYSYCFAASMQFDVAWIRKRTWFNVPKYLFSAVAIHLQWLIGSVSLCRLSAETPFRGKTRTNQRKLVLDGDGWTSASSGHETEWSVRPRRCRLSLPLLWKLDNSVTALQETETITILTHYHHHHDKNHYHYSVYLHSVLLSIL